MASTAITEDEDKREYFDSPEELETKIDELAMMIGSSEHFIAFTGAGISTSAGIADYRSGMDTVLETGPGCWELAANKGKKSAGKSKAKLRTSIAKACPTKTHMAYVGLLEAGFLKFMISQNVDGLHRKSGIPAH